MNPQNPKREKTSCETWRAHSLPRPTFWLRFVAAFSIAALMFTSVFAQNYSIVWSKIAGGGGTSSGGQYILSGTIGQPDAGGPMTGGNFSLTGGFWSLYAVLTPGAPALNISRNGNTVTVYWQNVAGWNLVQSGNLATPIASWSASSSPTLTGGTNYLNLANPAGNLFFRLKNQ